MLFLLPVFTNIRIRINLSNTRSIRLAFEGPRDFFGLFTKKHYHMRLATKE